MQRLSKTDFEAWRGHRVTERVHKYLQDRQDEIQDQWRAGRNWTDETRYFVQALEDLRNLTFEDMEEFYARDEESLGIRGNGDAGDEGDSGLD